MQGVGLCLNDYQQSTRGGQHPPMTVEGIVYSLDRGRTERPEICRKAGYKPCYYPDPETAEKQCFRTIQNTRYTQQFATNGAGSSVFTIPPNNGIQDIVLNLEFQSNTDVAPATLYGLALPAGWGYGLIRQVSYRYGGSSQYFLTGQQLLQLALRKCPNASARDDLFNLGGNAAAAGAAAAGDFNIRQRAYLWMPLPHTIPTAEGKLPPFPSDLNKMVSCY